MEVFEGFLMALADRVPGVSGGTVAFLFGFYDRLIDALGRVTGADSARRKMSLRYLLRLGVGWCAGMALAMTVLSRLFNRYIYPVSSLFLGFVLASIPVVIYKERKALHGHAKALYMAAIGFIIVYATARFGARALFEMSLARITVVNGVVLFVAAVVAASAMILPGISGSSLLMAFGLYLPLISEVSALLRGEFAALPAVALFGLGALTGLFSFIRLLKNALTQYRAHVIYAVLGMMTASLYAVAIGPTTLRAPQAALTAATFNLPCFFIGGALIAAMTAFELKKSARGALCGALLLALLSGNASALEARTPCIDAPYDYQYQDDEKQILIRKFSEYGVTYFVADVQLAQAGAFKTALSEDRPFGKEEKLSTIAVRNGAILAINGDDYGTHKFGTIIRNGALLRAQNTTRNMLIVDADGNFSVRADRAREDPDALGKQLIESGARQTFEFGPELIRDRQAAEFNRSFDVISTKPSRREPRTAIGQIEPLHYVIIVADGRQDGYSKGLTLGELQTLFLRYGTQTAMNLDGGGSTEMWFMGEIINRPSGGKERRLSDIIYF